MQPSLLFSGRYFAFVVAAFLIAAPLLATPSQAAEKSLYERLGGVAAITVVVDDFSARQLADDRLNKYYKNTNKPEWKKHLTDLICKASGGPCTYSGRAMNRAHARMYITDDQFNWTAAHLVASLTKFKVPKKEQDELVAIVASLKGQIVRQ